MRPGRSPASTRAELRRAILLLDFIAERHLVLAPPLPKCSCGHRSSQPPQRRSVNRRRLEPGVAAGDRRTQRIEHPPRTGDELAIGIQRLAVPRQGFMACHDGFLVIGINDSHGVPQRRKAEFHTPVPNNWLTCAKGDVLSTGLAAPPVQQKLAASTSRLHRLRTQGHEKLCSRGTPRVEKYQAVHPRKAFVSDRESSLMSIERNQSMALLKNYNEENVSDGGEHFQTNRSV